MAYRLTKKTVAHHEGGEGGRAATGYFATWYIPISRLRTSAGAP